MTARTHRAAWVTAAAITLPLALAGYDDAQLHDVLAGVDLA